MPYQTVVTPWGKRCALVDKRKIAWKPYTECKKRGVWGGVGGLRGLGGSATTHRRYARSYLGPLSSNFRTLGALARAGRCAEATEWYGRYMLELGSALTHQRSGGRNEALIAASDRAVAASAAALREITRRCGD